MTPRSNAISSIKAQLAVLSIQDGRFTPGRRVHLAELVASTGLGRPQVMRCMARLARSGWVRELDPGLQSAVALGQTYGPPRRNPTWAIVADIRLRRDHQVRSRATCRDRIWSTLRAQRACTKSRLCILTGCALPTVEEYLGLLRRAGYVAPQGKHGREKVWRLIKDAGPKRPEAPARRKHPEMSHA